MMEDQAMDGSNEGNLPERFPHSSYSRDSAQEDQEISHHHQVRNKMKIKKEVKEEAEEAYVRGDERRLQEETSPELPMGSSQEGYSSSHHDQDENLVYIKQEKEEEERVRGGEPCMEERTPQQISPAEGLEPLCRSLHQFKMETRNEEDQQVPCLKIIGGEELIEHVKDHPELYDPLNRQYKNKDKKKRAWLEVASHVVIGWGDMEGKERDLQVLLLQKRWRNMRDSFKKELKFRKLPRGSGARPHTPYQYYECMKFLKDCLEMRPTSSNGQELPDGKPSPYRRGQSRRNRAAARQAQADPWAELSVLIRNLRQQIQEDRNPMLNFLKSLLPTMDCVDPSYHCAMKMELLDVVEKFSTMTASLHQSTPYVTLASSYDQPHQHLSHCPQP